MRPGHAGDDCRHVKIDLISVSVVSDWWAVCAGINALITAYRRNDRECPTQTSGKHPVMRLAALPPPLDEHGSSPLLSRKRDVDTAWSKRQPHSLSRRDAIDDNSILIAEARYRSSSGKSCTCGDGYIIAVEIREPA